MLKILLLPLRWLLKLAVFLIVVGGLLIFLIPAAFDLPARAAEVMQRINAAANSGVRIQAMPTAVEGFPPRLVLEDLALSSPDAPSRPTLVAERTVVRVDVAESLTRGEVVVRADVYQPQIYADRSLSLVAVNSALTAALGVTTIVTMVGGQVVSSTGALVVDLGPALMTVPPVFIPVIPGVGLPGIQVGSSGGTGPAASPPTGTPPTAGVLPAYAAPGTAPAVNGPGARPMPPLPGQPPGRPVAPGTSAPSTPAPTTAPGAFPPGAGPGAVPGAGVPVGIPPVVALPVPPVSVPEPPGLIDWITDILMPGTTTGTTTPGTTTSATTTPVGTTPGSMPTTGPVAGSTVPVTTLPGGPDPGPGVQPTASIPGASGGTPPTPASPSPATPQPIGQTPIPVPGQPGMCYCACPC